MKKFTNANEARRRSRFGNRQGAKHSCHPRQAAQAFEAPEAAERGYMIRVYNYNGKVPSENKCTQCHIPMQSNRAYCDVCQSMLEAVIRLPFFSNAQLEWAEENQRRIDNKA